MAKLYVVGNGFDIYHGLDTRFSDFEIYLKNHNREVLDAIYRYYSFENGNDLWSNFEENLAHLDKVGLLDDLSQYLPVFSIEDFSWDDYHAAGFESEKLLKLLTSDLRAEFSRFILKAETKNISNCKLVHLHSGSKFVSFNYTRTLEKLYQISIENITYIHGVADMEDQIVLGHATDPSLFIEKKFEATPPEGMTEEELENWHEQISDSHDPQYESLVEDVNSYFYSSFKDTNRIINECSDYFCKLNDVTEIYILGHSMSDVDLAYFMKLLEVIHPDCHWFVSYYGCDEESNISGTLDFLGIPSEKYHLIQLNDLSLRL